MQETVTGRIVSASSPYVWNPNDERNREILTERVKARFENYGPQYHKGPQVGDYVEFPDSVDRSGEYERQTERISHDWGDSCQTSPGGSWYLGEGYASFSGALNPSLPKERLIDTGETRMGSFWFFDHDYARAGAGVQVELACKVYRYATEEES